MAAEQFNIDYHRLLGVNRNADEQTIRRAFRQLSRQHHPDKGGQEEMMKLLNEAKATLLDPEKRAEYEANNEPSASDLSADLLRLNIGHRLSDDFKVKIEQWKQQYQRIQINDNVNVLNELIKELQETIFSKTTVFDLGSNQLINQGKSEEVMLKELKALFVAQDFANIAQYILTHQCRAALTKLYNDNKPTHGYELPCRLKALLLIIKASSAMVLAGNHPQQDRIKGLYDAVLTYPTDECIDCVLKLINNRVTDAHKQEFLDTINTHSILDENAVNKKHMQRLRNTPTLKSIWKYENGIHKENIESMDQAMLYIDLNMIYGHPIVLTNNLVLAAKKLIEHMMDSTDAAEVYALKNCVVELCETALHFVTKYANPISQLKYSTHVFRLMCKANSILVSLVNGQHLDEDKEMKPLIGDHDQELFKRAIHCVSKSMKVSPIIDTALDMSSDVVYIDLINNKLLQKYYQWNIDTYSGHPSLHLYQYMLMEGSWKNWFDHSKFTEYRQKCIKIMLSKFNMTETSMAKTMKAEISCIIPKPDNQSNMDTIETKPMIMRCEEGWLVPGANYLNMGKMSFSSVDGLVVDEEQGTFKIIVSTDENIGPLCDGQDIDEIVTKGLSHSVFSLDQVNNELDFHPCQSMRFSPKRLENTRYLTTLLAADYLLKMIATNSEVSAQPPFEIKQAIDGFLKSLPADLRKYIMMKKDQTSYGKAHRFWIENGEIPCYENVDDNGKRTFEFYYTPMLVKKNLLKKNSDGKLVDDSDDSEGDLTDEDSEYETDAESNESEGDLTGGDSEDESNNEPILPKKKISAEARFARRFTEYYDLIGCYFPVLLRLRELAKLNAISEILRDIYRSSEEKKQKLIPLRDAVRKMLEDVRREITYPICTESKINDEYWKTLHFNGIYDEDRVLWNETVRVKDEIRNDLNNAEKELFINLSKQLSDCYKIANTPALGELCRNWLAHGSQEELANYLSNTIANCSVHDQIEKLSRYVNNLNALGVNVAAEDSTSMELHNGGWVPATFSHLDGRSIYGGVALLPKLSLQTDRGFKGFQAKKGNSSKSRKESGRDSKSGSNNGASDGGNNGNGKRSKKGREKGRSSKGGANDGASTSGGGNGNEPTTKKEIMEKYGRGKDLEWPPEPIKTKDGQYFGKPHTSYITNQGVRVDFGPSGWGKIHNTRFSTRTKAKQTAERESLGGGKKKVISDRAHGKIRKQSNKFRDDQQKKDDYNKNKKGDNSSHFHRTDADGNKIWDKHYLHPK